MITVARQPVTWIVEIKPHEGQTWPVVTDAVQDSYRMRPEVLALTVFEDELPDQPLYLDVRYGYRVRQDGTPGIRVGEHHSVRIADMPASVVTAVQIAMDSIRAEAHNWGLI